MKTLTPKVDLTGWWHLSYKIDGTRVVISGGKVLSRAGKHFVTLESTAFIKDVVPGVYEFFRTSWGETQSLLRSFGRVDEIVEADLYSLDPIDKRLAVCSVLSPSRAMIRSYFDGAIAKGYEGLVLRNDAHDVYKMKTVRTIDVRVTGKVEGKGRNVGRLGAILTDHGNIGTGITDAMRVELWNDPDFFGSIVEAQCMEFSDKGIMRHPRFIRRRLDKDEENLDG